MTSEKQKGIWYNTVRRYVQLSHNSPWLPILLIGLMTWFTTFLSSKLKIDTDLRVLLPTGTQSVVALQEAEKRMGSTDFLTFAFQSPSAEEVGRFQKTITDSIVKWKEVVWAQYDQDRSFFEKHALVYMPTGELEDLRDRISGMIGNKFAKANPLIESLDDDAEKPTLKGWPNVNALRRQGLPQDLVDALLAKVNPPTRVDSAIRPMGGAATVGASALVGSGPSKGPGDFTPNRPDSLKSRLMGWHEGKKLWIGVVLVQLNHPSTDAIFAKGIYERGTALIKSMHPEKYGPDFLAQVVGAYRNFDEINQVSGDIVTAGTISFGLMLVLLWFFVRKVVNLVLINIPLLVAMSWTTGATYLVYHRLTLLTAFILALILGLGIEYTVHLYSRWAEENRKGLNPLDAMIEAVAGTGRSLLAGAATNIFAMVSLQIGNFKGFKEFGIVVSIGITFALISTWLVIPPLFFFFSNISAWIRNHTKSRFLLKIEGWLLPGRGEVKGGELLPNLPWMKPKPLKLVAMGGILFTVAISFAPQVGFENDFGNLRGKSTGSGISYGRAVGAGRNTSPSVILGKSEAQMRSIHDSLVLRYDSPADSMMKSYATIQSFVPAAEEQTKRVQILAEIKGMLDLRAMDRVDSSTRVDLDLLKRYLGVGTFTFDSIPLWSQRFLTESDGSHGKFGYLYGELHESDALESAKFQKRFGSLPSKDGDVMVASSGFIYADVVQMVKSDGPFLAIVTFLFLIVITWLDMRSWRGVVISCGFVLLSAFWTYKIMGLIGLRLGMYNLVVLPTILSVSVDSVIHLYHRRCELGAGRMVELYRTTGSAVLTGTLNNAFGFLGLCFVSHKGMQTIGNLATLGIGTGLVVMFTMLPWFLEMLCPREPVKE